MSQKDNSGNSPELDCCKSLVEFLQQKIKELEKKHEEVLLQQVGLGPMCLSLHEFCLSLQLLIINMRALKENIERDITLSSSLDHIDPIKNKRIKYGKYHW